MIEGITERVVDITNPNEVSTEDLRYVLQALLDRQGLKAVVNITDRRFGDRLFRVINKGQSPL
jgi:hypothetical protein